jgi:hypothetical protein
MNWLTSYCNGITNRTSCVNVWATKRTLLGNYYNGWTDITKYKAITFPYTTENAANVTEVAYHCCEWSEPSS